MIKVETFNSMESENSVAAETKKLNVKADCLDQPDDGLHNLEFSTQIDEKNMSINLIENFISHSVFGSEDSSRSVGETDANEAPIPVGEKKKIKGKIKRQYACNQCRKTFVKKYSLDRHVVVHSNKKKYVCDTCNRSFGEKHHLVEHKRIHSGEKPYVCDVCNTAFAHKSTLCRHRLIHTGEKPYVCDSCKKAFNKKSTLDRHKLVHTGQKPYVCNVCNNQYRHKQSLDQHKLNHHRT